MVTLLLDRARLEVVLSPVERALAFHRENLRIDREAITKVQLTDDPWTWLRGVAAPGTHIPATIAAGTWKTQSGVDFVMIRRRKPGVVIDLEGAAFERLVLTTRHGLALIKALRLDVSSEPADVSELAEAPSAGPARKRRTPKPAVKPA